MGKYISILFLIASVKIGYAQFKFAPHLGINTVFSRLNNNNIIELPKKSLLSPSIGMGIEYERHKIRINIITSYSSYFIQGKPISMLFVQPDGIAFKTIQTHFLLRYELTNDFHIGPVFLINSVFDNYATQQWINPWEYRKLVSLRPNTIFAAGISLQYVIEDFTSFLTIQKSFDFYGHFFNNDNHFILGLGISHNLLQLD